MLHVSIDEHVGIFFKERFMVNGKAKRTGKKSVKKTGSSPKRTTSKKKSTGQEKKPSEKKNLSKGVYKEKDTLKIRRTNISELEKVENVIVKLSKKPEPGVRVTVPGVLRIASSVPKTVPSAQKAIPIVEIKNYLKKLFGINA
ncbi:MAG: hypothetical protein A3D13_03370 [Planctomycetes bacterium RIFCSPHIGHO2_02_FULL_40_12]|nr:MAG: hypothetical protein A3D13_03370 [Planctomycetes bacterium RIFCSPHIGHO2_02_FULL_40_12]